MRLRISIILIAGIFLLQVLPIRKSSAWGFFAHRRINRLAIFTLPPQMMLLYKPNIEFITEHATDPDKLRYVLKEEGSHHYIDIDHYGIYPWNNLPRNWNEAVQKFSRDSLLSHGIVPWHALQIYYRLEEAFKRKDQVAILKWSAYLGHYVSDACVPLHATSNYNGQFTGQNGIHALWESNIPELLADSTFDYWTGKAEFIDHPGNYIWELVLESGKAAESVLRIQKQLLQTFPQPQIYAFTSRNSQLVRSFSPQFVTTYNLHLQGMVEHRMSQSIHAISSLWYTAWVNAGQPDLQELTHKTFSEEEETAFKTLDQQWHGVSHPDRNHE